MVIDDLREANPISASLDEIIRAEVNEFSAASGIICEVSLPNGLLLSEEMRLHLKKIIGEGLTNIRRHAGAQHCWVTLQRNSDRLSLEIIDDGQGFDPEKIQKYAGHYGLKGMRERVSLLGGEMRIDSSDKGTKLLFSLPVEEAE